METATRSVTDFVTAEGYYHVLYPLAGTWVSAVGLSPPSVELILPLLLSILGLVLVQAIVLRELADMNAAMFALGASMWFAFFRLSSDLHASLMALVLMLGGTMLFLHLTRELNFLRYGIGSIGLGAVVLVSSLSHVETTLFMSAIWLLTFPIGLWRKWAGVRRSLLMATAILVALVPGLCTYLNQLRLTTGPLEGRLPTIPTMSPIIWLGYFGPVGVAVLVALPVAYRSNLSSVLSTRFGALSICWLTLSLVVGLTQYAYSPLTPFSERAIIMTPTPFLAGVLLPRIRNLGLASHAKGVALISLIMIGGTGMYYVGIGHVYYNSFISSSASLTLHDLRSKSSIDSGKSIFVFYEAPVDGGGLAEHDSFWTAAYLGDHYSYFGRVDFLMAGLETPFVDDRSTLISRRFFGALSLETISGMSIVYLEEFNVPRRLPIYYRSFLIPLVNGSFLLDQAKWKSQEEVFVPAFSSVLSTSQNWRSEPQDWADTGTVLKFDSERGTNLANATVALAIPETAVYSVSLRVWDTSKPASSVLVFLDGTQVGRVSYNGTLVPVSLTVFSENLTRGVHYLSLAIPNQVGLAQFLSLDYLSIKR